MHFGYPFCHEGTIADPEFGASRKCGEFQPPAQRLAAHAGAVGMRFYTGSQFPAALPQSDLHRRARLVEPEPGVPFNGNRVSVAHLEGGKVVRYEPFAEGWLDGRTRWGRPVDLEVLPDGSMLVSDDMTGVIYRITYAGK